MLNDFPLLSADRKNAIGCYAAMPGSGPAGEACSRCQGLVADGSRFYCSRYTQMMRRQGKPISPGSAACRHFEQRRRFNEEG